MLQPNLLSDTGIQSFAKSFFLSKDEFHLKVPCRRQRCGTAAWRCCRATWPASLNQSWVQWISVLPSWEWPSNSYTREWRSSLPSQRTRSVRNKKHFRKTAGNSFVTVCIHFFGPFWNTQMKKLITENCKARMHVWGLLDSLVNKMFKRVFKQCSEQDSVSVGLVCLGFNRFTLPLHVKLFSITAVIPRVSPWVH